MTMMQTKRRWLRSVLDAAVDPMPTRVFPREPLGQTPAGAEKSGMALRLKSATRPTTRRAAQAAS
jgi:hypothetical protein